jgi:hypothetical protein
MSASGWSAVASVVTAAVTAVYVWLTFRLVRLTKMQIDASQTPHLSCRLILSGDDLSIVIKNHSEWPAYSLRTDAVAIYWDEDEIDELVAVYVREERQDEAKELVLEEEGLVRLGIYDRFHTQVVPARHELGAEILCPPGAPYVIVLCFFRTASQELVLQAFTFNLERGRYRHIVSDEARPVRTDEFDFPVSRSRIKYGLRGRVRRLRGHYVPPKAVSFREGNLPKKIPPPLRRNYDLLQIIDGHVVVPGWLNSWSGDLVEDRGDVRPSAS